MRQIIIFDTTLRDGEQSPGASLNTRQKLEIARALAQLKVDVIEAGFPIASPDDFEAVRRIAQEIEGPTICGLARTLDADIDRAAEAVRPAKRPRIHVFCATSEIHRTHKLRKAKEEIVRLTEAGVKRARSYTDDVEFSPEDASRTEPDFLVEVVTAAIEAGATTINIPDTVGYALPQQFGPLIRMLKERVPNMDQAVISVHCHNDLGLGVANSLAAVEAGADQVECTINGLGERAGNASLEEVVMALRTRTDVFPHCVTNIVTQRLLMTSRLVSGLTGMRVQRNKAIVGENAFAHEAGIHQDGILKERTTYEIMRPQDVGFTSTHLVLGKHSGRHALRERILALGHEIDEAQLDRVFERFKVLADKKKEVFDEDVEALIDEELSEAPEYFRIKSLHTSSGSETIPTATVQLSKADGATSEDAAIGDGPVDAVYKAIERITGISAKLREYNIRAVTGGKDALGEVTIQIESEGHTFRGRGLSTDIIMASAFAYLNAINKIAAATASRKDAEQ